jgi:hypothetical protein
MVVVYDGKTSVNKKRKVKYNKHLNIARENRRKE